MRGLIRPKFFKNFPKFLEAFKIRLKLGQKQSFGANLAQIWPFGPFFEAKTLFVPKVWPLRRRNWGFFGHFWLPKCGITPQRCTIFFAMEGLGPPAYLPFVGCCPTPLYFHFLMYIYTIIGSKNQVFLFARNNKISKMAHSATDFGQFAPNILPPVPKPGFHNP